VTLGLLAIVFGFTEQSLVALVIGATLLALFFWIERRALAPLVAIDMLALPFVRWGNVAVLTIFSNGSRPDLPGDTLSAGSAASGAGRDRPGVRRPGPLISRVTTFASARWSGVNSVLS
jgi:hypothetical protein